MTMVSAIPMNCELRTLSAEDVAIVWQMLMHAAHEPSLTAVKSQPALARYVEEWGRPGDLGLVALVDQQPVGAAWLRLWRGVERGYGFVDERVPELAIALLPRYRNQGIGTQLLKQLITLAQGRYPAISLNVRAENSCVRLYERLGFVKIENSEAVNRTGGISFNMICRLNPSFSVPSDSAAVTGTKPVITVRPMEGGDLGAMRSLFANTVRLVNSRDYSPEQVEAWAASADDTPFWIARLAKSQVWVAEHDGQVVGFTNLEAYGHIDMFFVHHRYQGYGVGTQLLNTLESAALEISLTHLFAEVSLTAKPFFLKKGFQVVKEETVELKGLEFTRFVMEKTLR